VLASKLGAVCNLLTSPLKTKLGCWDPALGELLPDEAAELAIPDDAGRRSIQGTATCFPVPGEVDELIPVALVGDEVTLLAPLLGEREITPNSRRPLVGLIIVSLMVPTSPPEDAVIGAPVNWLPRTGCWPIRPVALKPRLVQPDWPVAVAAPPYEEPGVAPELG